MTASWLRGWEPVGVAVSLTIVAALAWQVHTGGGVVRVDERVSAGGVISSPWLTVLAALGSPEVSGAVLGITAMHQAFFRGRWWPIALAAGNATATAVVVLALKALIGRRGPDGLPLDGYPGYFPSGHTTTATVCFGTAAYIVVVARSHDGLRRSGLATASEVGKLGLVVGVLVGTTVGTAVGAATVFTANHWLSDVVAALAVGFVVQVLGFAVLRRHLG